MIEDGISSGKPIDMQENPPLDQASLFSDSNEPALDDVVQIIVSCYQSGGVSSITEAFKDLAATFDEFKGVRIEGIFYALDGHPELQAKVWRELVEADKEAFKSLLQNCIIHMKGEALENVMYEAAESSRGLLVETLKQLNPEGVRALRSRYQFDDIQGSDVGELIKRAKEDLEMFLYTSTEPAEIGMPLSHLVLRKLLTYPSEDFDKKRVLKDGEVGFCPEVTEKNIREVVDFLRGKEFGNNPSVFINGQKNGEKGLRREGVYENLPEHYRQIVSQMIYARSDLKEIEEALNRQLNADKTGATSEKEVAGALNNMAAVTKVVRSDKGSDADKMALDVKAEFSFHGVAFSVYIDVKTSCCGASHAMQDRQIYASKERLPIEISRVGQEIYLQSEIFALENGLQELKKCLSKDVIGNILKGLE